MATKKEGTRHPMYIKNLPAKRQRNGGPYLMSTTRGSNARQETNASFSKLPQVAVETIAESLIARGQLKTLANLNATSKAVHHDTLAMLWRTVIWDPIGKTQAEQDECWKTVMIDSPGSRYIQFIVDRKTFVPNTTKDLPELARTSTAYKAGTLKGYIARFDDIKNHHIKSDDPKVVIHLLPAYHPLSEDLITMRHGLYMIYEWITTGDVYYLFLVHTPDSQPRRRVPSSIDHYRVLPSMPIMLELVYIVPQANDFVHADRQQVSGIIFDFLVSISHKPDPKWNAFVGEFASKPITIETECEGYIDFTWQDRPESAILDAECTVKALEAFRGSSRPWIQLSYGIETYFPEDNNGIHKILRMLKPLYMERAPNRRSPPLHGLGDITVQDWSLDLLGGLKRVVPHIGREKRDAVECFIKRFPSGKGKKADGAKFGNSHDKHVVFYEEYPVRG